MHEVGFSITPLICPSALHLPSPPTYTDYFTPPAHLLAATPAPSPVTGVCAPPTGVGARLGTLLLLCAMCAFTR
jgi:hypothetical protein